MLAFTGQSSAADLAGGWKGTWTRDGDGLPVTVTFEKRGGAYIGSFESDALMAAGTALSDVSDTDGEVHWSLKGEPSTTVFEGMLEGDTLAGTIMQGGAHGTFTLARADLPAAAIVSHDVTLAAASVTLAGTLLLPRTRGPHPAVMFVNGFGPDGRWANRYLAQKFAESGTAALVFDPRGVGASSGDWQKAGFDALADDVLMAIRYLRAQEGIDPARIGIYGFGQAGAIVPMVAARDGHLAFVIASAAAGIAPDDVERFRLDNSLDWKSLSPADRKDAVAYVQALIDVGYRGKPRAKLDALAATLKNRSWYFVAPPPADPYWTISRQTAQFLPWIWWRQVKAPVLLVYGGHDEQVPPVKSADAIRAALSAGSNPPVRLQYYPDADHTFTIVDPAKKGGWPRKVDDYAAVVTGWAAMQTGVQVEPGQ